MRILGISRDIRDREVHINENTPERAYSSRFFVYFTLDGRVGYEREVGLPILNFGISCHNWDRVRDNNECVPEDCEIFLYFVYFTLVGI